MRSRLPKVLHTIGGRSLIEHAVSAARGTRPHHLVVVVRAQRDRVAEHVAELDPDVVVADQDEVPGTGRAVECGLAVLLEIGMGLAVGEDAAEHRLVVRRVGAGEPRVGSGHRRHRVGAPRLGAGGRLRQRLVKPLEALGGDAGE